MTLEYVNTLSSTLIIIISLLAVFSITIFTGLITSSKEGKVYTRMFMSSIVSTLAFIISLFFVLRVFFQTTNGFYREVTASSIRTTLNIGGIFFLLGLTAILVIIGLSGFTKNRKLGRITTVLSILTFIAIMFASNF